MKAILGHTASSSGVHETLSWKEGREGRRERRGGKKGRKERWEWRDEEGIEGRKLSGYSDKLRLVS